MSVLPELPADFNLKQYVIDYECYVGWYGEISPYRLRLYKKLGLMGVKGGYILSDFTTRGKQLYDLAKI